MIQKYAPDYGYTAAPLLDGRVLLFGTDDFSTWDVEVYDAATGTFSPISTTNSGFHQIAPSSRLADGKILIAGGQVAGGSGSTGATLFVPASATFETTGSLTVPRHSHSSTTLLDGTVLITGGYSVWSWPNPQPTQTAEFYTPR